MRAVCFLAACAALIAVPDVQPLTTVVVAVEDQQGAPVERLTATDFSLHVDGQAVAVEKVTHDSAGLNLAVVLDLTASGFWPGASSGSAFPAIKDHVLARLQDDTAVLVGSFGRSVRWSGEFSTDQSEQLTRLRAAVSVPDAERTGPSPVWDAVGHALAALEPRRGRRAILLVTDGQATGNRLGLADVADRAMAAAIAVNVVFTGSSGLIRQTRDMLAGVHPERPLVQLARATGGYYSARPQRESLDNAPVDALRKATRAMQSVYRVEFRAPVKEGFQRLEVRTRNPDLRVRAPLGFKNAPASER